jgi:hypothetical protein
MMQIVPYLAGGLTAFLVADIIPLPSPTQFIAMRSAVSAPAPLQGTPGSAVNRATKTDRGAAVRTTGQATQIATVEVVGLRDAAIVYRDRDGRELFRTDPLNNVTVMTKGLQLPEVTVRQNSSSVVRTVPINEIREQAREQAGEQTRERKPPPRGPKVPLGCEPSFSPVAAPSMAHHTGRCMAALEAARNAG